jgi:hypothetical protein
MSFYFSRPFCGLLMIALLNSCEKKTPEYLLNAQQTLIDEARSYVEKVPAAKATGNPRIDASKDPYWPAAMTLNTSKGPAVLVPVFYQQDLVVTSNFSGNQLLPLNQLTHLLIYKTPKGYQAQVLTAFPDTSVENLSGGFSGFLFIEAWQGPSLIRYSIKGAHILTQTLESNTEKSSQVKTEIDNSKAPTGVEAGCGTISGYNYSPALPGETTPWSESSGCNYTSSGSLGNSSLLSSREYSGLVPLSIGRMPGLQTIVETPPGNIVANIADYIKCFSNYGGNDHSYQVTVCVDQPVSGSRTAWTTISQGIAGSSFGANPINAGHTWLVLTEKFGTYSIVRNVGFYPKTNVTPSSPSAASAFGDDDGHPYDISLTITVDNGQFFNILNYISESGSTPYNLNTDNCTTFAIQACLAGNIELPNTKASWPDGGFGNDPGDLGEDFRSMSLSSNMSRSGYTPLPNQYNCN